MISVDRTRCRGVCLGMLLAASLALLGCGESSTDHASPPQADRQSGGTRTPGRGHKSTDSSRSAVPQPTTSQDQSRQAKPKEVGPARGKHKERQASGRPYAAAQRTQARTTAKPSGASETGQGGRATTAGAAAQASARPQGNKQVTSSHVVRSSGSATQGHPGG